MGILRLIYTAPNAATMQFAFVKWYNNIDGLWNATNSI